MTKIYLDKTSYTIITRENNGEPYDGEDTSTDWTFGEVSLLKGSESFETDFDVNDGDKIYVVVAVWSTGDSFSHHSQGESEIFGVFKTEEEADNFKTYFETVSTDNYYVDWGGRKIHLPWYGYFEHLDYVEVLKRIV